jgi:hypothetical protein
VNTNALRKNYDKLTVKERFSAIEAAVSRHDDDELRALNDAAPRKTYSVVHHRFLSEAFLSLAMLHRCAQLEKAGLLLLIHTFDNERGERIFPDLLALANQYRRDGEAWRQICAEYSIDPAAMLADLPGDGVIELSGEMIEILADEPDPVAVAQVVQSWRDVIADIAGPIE